MIKLFRNMRQNLLADPPERAFSVRAGGKTSRYLKYAIGEIILVVIGILVRKIIHWTRPVRDIILVELNRKINQRAVRYAI